MFLLDFNFVPLKSLSKTSFTIFLSFVERAELVQEVLETPPKKGV